MRIFRTLYTCLLLVPVRLVPSMPVDVTLVSGSTGAAVVEACVTKIRKSGIFAEDYDFLRNIAYVETLDGAELTTAQPGGIWQLSLEKFTQMQNSTYDVSSYYAGINEIFGIDWTTVTYDDMAIPLRSAMAMRLFIAHLQAGVLLITTAEFQSIVWAVQITSTEETVTYFLTRENAITGCTQPSRDVVFLVDSSIESGGSYLGSVQSVLSNVIKQLKIDSNINETVVGVAQYSSFLRDLTYLNGTLSETDLLSFVSDAELLSGARHTGLATANVLTEFFTTANGAKGWSSGLPQVLCVIVAADSDDSTENIAAAAANEGVSIIAVGMTTDATEEHLMSISTGRDADTTFHSSNYTSLTDLEFALKRQICESTTVPQTGAKEITVEVEPDKPKYVTLSVPAEGLDAKVEISTGIMDMYYSALITSPSSAYYDYSLNVPSPNQKVQFRYVPTDSELGHYDGVTVNLYITLESSASLPTVFTITLDETTEATIVITVDVAPNTTETPNSVPSGSGGLSAGEIAGIVFSCLVVICAILVAVVYYRFGKPGFGHRALGELKKLDGPMDSSDALVIETAINAGNGTDMTKPAKGTAMADGANDTGHEPQDQQRQLESNVRERLNSAIRRRDIAAVSEAVEDFMALRLEDYTGDFVKAQRMIAVNQCKQGIAYAVNSKNIKILEKAIFKGKRMEYDVELKIELVNAEIILQDLKKTDNLLRRLKRAIDGSDIATVELVTAELRVLRGCDQAMVDRLLLAFQFREDIEEAMLRRDMSGINESLARIYEKGLEHELVIEVKQAKKMIKDLKVVENARNEVMGLKQSRVSEIRSYATPPPGVHEVMMAVYLILGYHPTQIQSWTAVQALMGKTGREGLRRMIGDLGLTGVDVMHARLARSLLENFDLHVIKDVSEALSVFYIFSRSIIKEVEKLQPEPDQDSNSSYNVLDYENS